MSDGAAAIRWIREQTFPSAIALLDWYHLAGWSYEEAGADLARSDKLAAVRGYVLANRRAIENCASSHSPPRAR